MKGIFLLAALLFLPSLCLSDEYVLVMSKNDNVCQHMLNIYNGDLKKYGQVKYKLHKEFNWIKWTKKEIRFRPADAPEQCENCTMVIDAKIARFDINNDSKDEAIVYRKSMLSGYNIDVYDIFQTSDLNMLDRVVDGQQYSSRKLKSFDSNDGTPQDVYAISEEGLRKLPGEMRSYIAATKARGDRNTHFVGRNDKIKFIKVKNRFYTYFEGPRDIGPDESYEKVEHYSIIAECMESNVLKNQCIYLLKEDKSAKKRAK